MSGHRRLIRWVAVGLAAGLLAGACTADNDGPSPGWSTSSGSSSSGSGGATGSGTGGTTGSGTGGTTGFGELGDPCSVDGECLSWHCADGVCCDATCATACYECDSDGKCGLAAKGTDECPATGELCDATGACACGVIPEAPGTEASCPADCSGGCFGSTCIILCDEDQECASAAISCPADYHCQVHCTGAQACQGSTLACPAAYECEVSCSCSGPGAQCCQGLAIQCSQLGGCALDCGGDSSTQSCLDAALTCGENSCSATCATGIDQPTVTCGSSCSCTPC